MHKPVYCGFKLGMLSHIQSRGIFLKCRELAQVVKRIHTLPLDVGGGRRAYTSVRQVDEMSGNREKTVKLKLHCYDLLWIPAGGVRALWAVYSIHRLFMTIACGVFTCAISLRNQITGHHHHRHTERPRDAFTL